MENKEKKLLSNLKRYSLVIKTQLQLSTVTINHKFMEKWRKKKEKKNRIQKCEIFWKCLVCNFGTLAKIPQYFTCFPSMFHYLHQ